MEDLIYRVLWVDDEPQNVDGQRLNASKRNILSLSYESWEEAFPVLKRDWAEITAIILDANCKINKSDSGPNQFFLSKAITDLNQFFGVIHRQIPWYILSEGTMDNYDTIMNFIKASHNTKDWGQGSYKKDEIIGKDNPLFDEICKIGKNQSNNIVLYRHRDTFIYLGNDALISDEARRIMLKALAVLYYPEENLNYEFAGNPIRKVVEYMFKAAYKYGLLTDVFLDERGNIRIWDSMQYLCGMDPSLKSNLHYRFGKKGSKSDYSDYESVFPTSCYYSFRGLLNYVNVDSHTLNEEGDSPYRIDAESKDLFHAYVLLLCHLITCFGKYVEQHPNIEDNKAKLTPTTDNVSSKEHKETKPKTALSFIGKVFSVINEDKFPTVGGCKIARHLNLKLGQWVRIEEVENNTEKDAKKYPFIVTKVSDVSC